MSIIEKSTLNQMGIYSMALKTLYHFGLYMRYPAQVDMTLDNLHSAALILLVESRRQFAESQMSVNVKA